MNNAILTFLMQCFIANRLSICFQFEQNIGEPITAFLLKRHFQLADK